MVSDKQKDILTKNGYTLDAVNKMSYQEVSKVIGEILAKSKVSFEIARDQTGKWDTTPKNVEVHSQDEKLRSMKVSYAKDIAIAMIHECALLKVDFRELEVMKAITDNSILMVGAMWSRL